MGYGDFKIPIKDTRDSIVLIKSLDMEFMNGRMDGHIKGTFKMI